MKKDLKIKTCSKVEPGNKELDILLKGIGDESKIDLDDPESKRIFSIGFLRGVAWYINCMKEVESKKNSKL